MRSMLTGYTDRLSIRPTQKISFMVSTDADFFDADIVRLLHGDTDPRGPGRKERLISTAVSGRYPGHRQPLKPGSYVTVDDHEVLRLAGDFTLFAWILPTRFGGGPQVILSKEGPDGSGYSVGLNATGRLTFTVGASQMEGGWPLQIGRWHWFAIHYEAAVGAARLRAGFHPRDFSFSQNMGGKGPLPRVISSAEQFTLGAALHDGTPQRFFNGRIADPRLFERCLSDAEVEEMIVTPGVSSLPEACVAAWDFSIATHGTRVHDVSRRGLHGVTHQSPLRALLGPHWTGRSEGPAGDAHAYSAMHFHEDSLTDARWQEDFALLVPDDLPSGAYAARIVAGAETDYLPFFVCPPAGHATAHLALLLPTFTYLAYGNEMYAEYGLNCVYDHYVDGTGVPLASSRHPLKTFRPERGLLKSVEGTAFARHFCADLYFIDWLDAIGQPIDILTDHDLHREGEALLSRYRGVFTGSHPEYVSEPMLDAMEGYLRTGGSLAYLGGNGFYSVTSLSDDGTLIEVRRPNGSRPWSSFPGEGHHATNGERGGLWRFRGRSPQRLVGVGFTAQGWTSRNECGLPRYYEQVGDRSHPLAADLLTDIGPDERIGDFETLGLGTGAAGDEIDRADLQLGTPLQAIVLATATGFSADYPLVIEERQDMNESSTLPHNPLVRSDIVSFETGYGGFVFSVGSMQWFSALSFNHYDNTVSRMTQNVIRRILSPQSR